MTVRGDAGPVLRAATERDHPRVTSLLQLAGLPLAGIPRDLDGFEVAERGGRVVGAIALERYGVDGLLRSAVVDPAERGAGIGVALVERMLDVARARQLRAVYLLTTTAERWFPRFGFQRVERSDVPEAMQASLEFREACPASAAVMRRSLAPGSSEA
jgi:N-acetylglutamate synthase-like GNAT family acetyltransferase